jgi:hypothetical protein
MKVKVSKTFAAYINKAAKALGFKAEASVVTMSERGYCLNVGSDAMLDAQDNGDYDWAEDEYKVIRVAYPDEYYATPKYLTTAELTRECRRRGVTTENELQQMLRYMCEI